MSEEVSKRCLAQGIQLGNTLVQLEQAISDKDADRVRDLATEFMAKAKVAECVPEQQRRRVQNASEALLSFGRSGDVQGARQAMELLRKDIGFPELVAVARRVTPHRTAFGFGKAIPISASFDGYRVVVDGRAELGFVPLARGAETFQTMVSLHPNSKVEMVPEKAPAPAPRVVTRAAHLATGPIGRQVEKNESVTGQGYVERVKEDGKVVQIRIFDADGRLQETIDRGSFQSLG